MFFYIKKEIKLFWKETFALKIEITLHLNGSYLKNCIRYKNLKLKEFAKKRH